MRLCLMRKLWLVSCGLLYLVQDSCERANPNLCPVDGFQRTVTSQSPWRLSAADEQLIRDRESIFPETRMEVTVVTGQRELPSAAPIRLLSVFVSVEGVSAMFWRVYVDSGGRGWMAA